MAGKVQLLDGGFQDGQGNALALGKLVLQLAQDGNLSENQGQVSGGISIVINLDENGNVSTNPAQYVWPTDELSPAGNSFTVWAYTAEGQPAWGPNYNLTVPTGATYSLTNWAPNLIMAPLASLGGLTIQTNGVNNIDQNVLDLIAGSGVGLTAGSDGSVTISASSGSPFWFNVQTYGATGNGSTDDTTAIQAAITAALAADGGVVYFPPGTYKIVPPTTNYVFDIGVGGLWFRGDGQGVSTIQVGASAGDYKVIFGPSANSDGNDITISDLTIDQNTANNPVNGSFNGGIPDRMVVWSNTGTANLTVNNAEFINLGCTNAIVSYAQKTTVSGCRFVHSGYGSVYYDCSVVYVVGENSTITGNIFIGVLNGAGSVCAIETHGGKQTVTGNSIYDFWVGMNITGVTSEGDTNTVAVTGNTIMAAYYGIQLWSYTDGGHTTGFGLHGVTVSDNSIRLTQTAWTTNPGAGGANIGNPCGIFLNPDNNLPTKNILISDNVVEYDLEANNTYPWNNAGFGIGYWDATEVSSVDGFRVIDNTIVNCPLPAVRVHVDGQNVEVSGNMIVNPGSSLNASVTSGFQTGIFLANYNNPALNVRVNNNTIVDNNSTTRMVYGLLIENQADSDVVALGNVINCTGATTSAFTSFATVTSGINPVIQFTQINPAVNGTNIPTHVGQCSIAYDPTTGKTYAVSPNGINWTAVTYGTAAPSGALFASAGDTVWNTTPTSGGFAGWKCISSGTPGTWCPVLLADTAGDVVLGGQPAGQYINYQGASGHSRWVLSVSGTETGSDAGSNFFLANYHDNGTQIGAPIEVVRSTGEVALSGTLFVGNTLTVTAGGINITGEALFQGSVVLQAAAPTVAPGQLGLGATTANTATAGSNTLPANPLGFLIVNVGGTEVKIPYYSA